VSGAQAIPVTPGFTGTLTTAVDGLVAADVRTPVLAPGGPGFDPDAPATNAGVAKESVTIPAGTTVAQHSTFDSDFGAGADVDLYLYECKLTSNDPIVQNVHAFKWVSSAEFDQYPFTPADEASMNKLLGV
jgi:8-oxo-dGTP diphosphatase